MADDDNQGNGGNRATVALVSEKVDGLRALTEKGFADVQRQLDAVSGTPAAIAALREHQRAQDQRLADLEAADKANAVHWPTFLVSLAALAAASAAALGL